MIAYCCSAVLNHLSLRSKSNLSRLRRNNAPCRRFRSELVPWPCRTRIVALVVEPLVVLVDARDMKDTLNVNFLLRPVSVTDLDFAATDVQD